jgi:hypothetical protein
VEQSRLSDVGWDAIVANAPENDMSLRGRELFDWYVASYLTHPDLMGLSVGTHVFNLTSEANAAHIPLAEITEEIGPLDQALRKALAARGKG